MSTESHVSGISGILGNTQLTTNMGASGISVSGAGAANHRSHKNSDGFYDEILVGCQVLQQQNNTNLESGGFLQEG